MLTVKDIHVYYGTAHVVFGASMDVQENEIVCLLGRNGAGKTTTLKSIIGLVPPKSGLIEFEGVDITRERAFKRARMGIGYLPEDRGLFPGLTVRENLRIAEIGSGHSKGIEKATRYFPILEKYLSTNAGSLSGGEQQMLGIGRSLVGNNRLLLLDECSQGLAPQLVESLADSILQIKKETSILLVEQNVELALNLADRCYIMRDGHIVFEGKPGEIRVDKKLQNYLTAE